MVPKVGLFFDFIKSSQGLAVVISVIVVVYLVAYDARWSKDARRDRFLGGMAQKTINGEFPDDVFRKFELVLKYGDGMETTGIKDPEVRAIAVWLKKGAIDHDWRVEILSHTVCGAPCVRLTNRKGLPLELCKHCLYPKNPGADNENTKDKNAV